MDLWHLNNIKVITLNCVDFVPFSGLDSFQKIISKKHKQTSVNLTSILDFIG